MLQSQYQSRGTEARIHLISSSNALSIAACELLEHNPAYSEVSQLSPQHSRIQRSSVPPLGTLHTHYRFVLMMCKGITGAASTASNSITANSLQTNDAVELHSSHHRAA
jgi:hypothetical protein